MMRAPKSRPMVRHTAARPNRKQPSTSISHLPRGWAPVNRLADREALVTSRPRWRRRGRLTQGDLLLLRSPQRDVLPRWAAKRELLLRRPAQRNLLLRRPA